QTSVWSGQTVNGNAILVAYTFGGDANLDGVVNGDDYFQIDSHVSQSGSVFGYFNGDFNYDGAVNGDDYFVIDSNVSASGLPMALSAVPEPAMSGLIAAALVISRRRRRR